MSEIKVDKLQGTSGSATAITFSGANATVGGTLAVTGVHTVGNNAIYTSDGGAVTQNTVQSLVKSWISANFDSQAYKDSFNQSSLSDIAGGSFRFTVTNNFADANYACGTEARYVDANGINTMTQENSFTRTTSQYQAFCSNDGASVTSADTQHYQSLLAGDLA